MRTRFDKVIGIDWDRHAIAVAREDATSNEKYVASDVEEDLNRNLENSDALIVDPPAAGLSKRVRDAVVQHQPSHVIYVSCNPATLARDLSELKKSFTIDSITPLDMFPQTAEIEVVAALHA